MVGLRAFLWTSLLALGQLVFLRTWENAVVLVHGKSTMVELKTGFHFVEITHLLPPAPVFQRILKKKSTKWLNVRFFGMWNKNRASPKMPSLCTLLSYLRQLHTTDHGFRTIFSLAWKLNLQILVAMKIDFVLLLAQPEPFREENDRPYPIVLVKKLI